MERTRKEARKDAERVRTLKKLRIKYHSTVCALCNHSFRKEWEFLVCPCCLLRSGWNLEVWCTTYKEPGSQKKTEWNWCTPQRASQKEFFFGLNFWSSLCAYSWWVYLNPFMSLTLLELISVEIFGNIEGCWNTTLSGKEKKSYFSKTNEPPEWCPRTLGVRFRPPRKTMATFAWWQVHFCANVQIQKQRSAVMSFTHPGMSGVKLGFSMASIKAS